MDDTPHRMSCMEIWGGNRHIDSAVSTPGIDVWVYSEPHESSRAGGDIHYVSMCAAGKISRFAVADVAGHGPTVDDLARKLRDGMRRHINTVDQSQFARLLNESMTNSAGGRFATALLVTYFGPSKHLVLCNAGHPRPLWYRAAERTWTILHHETDDETPGGSTADLPADLPLGVIDQTGYHQFAARFGRDDLLLLYTDALPEADDHDGNMLGEAGLLEIVRSLDPDDPAALPGALVERVTTINGGRPDDDITVMLLHHNGEDRRIHLTERLSGIARMLGLSRM